jgi:type II secretory pathway pseudopilin PulG
MAQKLRERGFGLLETAIAMVVVLGIAAGALQAYTTFRTQEMASRLYQEFMDLKVGIIRAYENKPGYEGMTEQALFQAGAIPQEMDGGDGWFYHSARFPIQIEPVNGGCTSYPGCSNSFVLKMFGLKPEVCRLLAEQDYGDGVTRYWIGNEHIYPPVSKDTLAAACDSAAAPSWRVIFSR